MEHGGSGDVPATDPPRPAPDPPRAHPSTASRLVSGLTAGRSGLGTRRSGQAAGRSPLADGRTQPSAALLDKRGAAGLVDQDDTAPGNGQGATRQGAGCSGLVAGRAQHSATWLAEEDASVMAKQGSGQGAGMQDSEQALAADRAGLASCSSQGNDRDNDHNCQSLEISSRSKGKQNKSTSGLSKRSRSGSNQPKALSIEHPSQIEPPVKAKGKKKAKPTRKQVKDGLLGSDNLAATNVPLDSPSMGTRSKKIQPPSPAMNTRSKRRLSL